MSTVVDSDRADEWGAPVRHALVYHGPSRTASCMCGRMDLRTADDAETANRMWLEHVRARADRLGARP